MARFNGSNIDQYGSQNSGNGISFFSLKNDKDCARVRFLYNGAEDIEGYTTHRVQVGDKEREVNCLRDYNDPIDKCPFCRARLKTSAKLYVPIFNEDSKQIQFWSRGKTFYAKLSGWCARYPNTVSRIFEIERAGKAGDTQTDYNFFPTDDPDGTTIDDILADEGLDKLPNPLGSIILDKSAEDMEYFLEHKDFPSSDSSAVRRRDSSSESRSEDAPRRRGRGDRY